MDEAHFRDLRQAIADGKVLAIVGAGVSIAATNNAPTASWVGLLKGGVRFVEEYHGRSMPEGCSTTRPSGSPWSRTGGVRRPRAALSATPPRTRWRSRPPPSTP